MQYVGLLAPIAFVFALSALAQIGSLKKEIDNLKAKINEQENKDAPRDIELD